MVRLFDKPVDDLAYPDLQNLLANNVPESRVLEYKLKLPGPTDDDRKDFAKDVSALANASGGVIIYGVATGKQGDGVNSSVPTSLPGLPDTDLDKAKLRLGQLLNTGVSPSLASRVRFREILGGEAGPFLAIGVPRSLDGPHLVNVGTKQIWRRGEVLNYQPDIAELRRMFLEPTAWFDEAEQFRAARLRRLKPRDDGGPSAVLVHVLPLGRFNDFIDLVQLEPQLRTMPLPHGRGTNWRFNADGYMAYFSDRGVDGRATHHVQFFRSGGLEFYSSLFRIPAGFGTPVMLNRDLPNVVRSFVGDALKLARTVLEIDPPFAVLLTMAGFKGCEIITERGMRQGRPIEEELIAPQLRVVSEVESFEEQLAPLFDIVWQHAGVARAPTD